MLLPDSMPCRLGRHGFFVELLHAVRRVLHVEIWATDCTRTSPSLPPSTNFSYTKWPAQEPEYQVFENDVISYHRFLSRVHPAPRHGRFVFV